MTTLYNIMYLFIYRCNIYLFLYNIYRYDRLEADGEEDIISLVDNVIYI